MREYLLEKICLVICASSLILRSIFINEYDIVMFMTVVNGLALWISITFILSKGKAKYRDRLKHIGRNYNTSRSYRKMIIVSRIISVVVLIIVCIISLVIKSIGDYITIFTLGIALADDFLADIYNKCFTYK